MTNTEISKIITAFLQKAIQMDLIEAVDEVYLRNRLMDTLHVDEYIEPDTLEEAPDLLETLDQMIQYAVQKGWIQDYQYERDIFEAKIMNYVTPLPSVVQSEFWERYDNDKEEATDYFYRLSQDNNYIKTRNIAKNIFFETTSPYGNLEITINLSKPEKDPKEIAAMKDTVSTNYPKCVLCIENEGYKGHANHAARENHRVVRMPIQDEIYGMQYSPYVYYNEHSIFLNEVHKPMVVDRRTIENLLEIIDILPHYFVGSNADLPIVGGSILSHDHYQGGRYQFPIEEAKTIEKVDLEKHPNVEASIVKWPLSVIRLRAEQKDEMVEAVTHIMDTWIDYSDKERSIVSHTKDIRHNTVTPIARFKEGKYEMDVVLRNNRTTVEYPDGIFHPHPDVHHIKKENIGLIEVMGLAILPPRLVEELQQLEDYLLDKKPISEVDEMHREWAEELKKENDSFDEKSVTGFIKQKVGDKFTRVLKDAGVFKQTDDGMSGFKKLIEELNAK